VDETKDMLPIVACRVGIRKYKRSEEEGQKRRKGSGVKVVEQRELKERRSGDGGSTRLI
jgi:hypothetical protein